MLERIHDRATWKKLVAFIEQYGEEIFTQRFLNLGNIRAILHQGVASWLTSLQEEPRDDAPQKLLDDLAGGACRSTKRPSSSASCWNRSSKTTANIATTTAPRRSPTAASCSTCCSIFCGCDRATIASAGI